MPGITDSLRILITCSGAQAEREFAKVGAASRRSLGQAETSAQQYSKVLTSAGIAMTTFGVVALAGLAKAAQAAEQERSALIRLENSIENMPELAGASTDAFLEQASALQQVTRYGDDVTVSAQAMLATFHLTEQQILELTPVVQDYASKFGVDLVEASKQVGKAVAGNRGVLQRNGIIIDENAYAADQFSATLNALRENAGGFAEEEGATLTGQIEKLKNNMGDLVEGVGYGAVVVFRQLADRVGGAADAFKKLDPQVQSAIGQVLTWGAVGLTAVGATSFLVGQLMKLGPAFSFIASIGPRAYAAIANLIVPTNALSTSTFALADAQTAVGASSAASLGAIGLWVAGMAALGIGLSVAVEKAGEWIGLDWPSGLSTNLHQWNGEVAAAIAANPDLVDALSTGKQGFENIGTAMAGASVNLDDLTQEIQDYLDGVYDLPEANRALERSFDDLFELQLSGTATTADLDAAYQSIVESIAGVVSAGGDADAVARSNILRLRDQKDAGTLTNEMYQEQRERILNIPGVSRTLFQQPGLAEGQAGASEFKRRLGAIPKSHETRVTTPGLEDGLADAWGFKRVLDAIPKTVTVQYKTVGGPIPKASGGPVEAGQTYLVGERGPELAVFGGSGTIIPAGQTARMMSGGRSGGVVGSGVTININAPVYGVDDLESKLAESARKYNLARGAA